MKNMHVMSTYKKQLLLLCFLAGITPLLMSFSAQYLFDIAPCNMCILERWPYVAITTLALIALFQSKLIRTIIKFMLFASLVSLGFSVYHTGIEYSLWPGTESCVGGIFTGTTAEELEAFLSTVPVRRCDQISKAFGIFSFSILNAVYSICLLIYFFVMLKNLTLKKCS